MMSLRHIHISVLFFFSCEVTSTEQKLLLESSKLHNHYLFPVYKIPQKVIAIILFEILFVEASRISATTSL